MCIVVRRAANEQRGEIVSLLRRSRIGRDSVESIRGMWVAMEGPRVVGTAGIELLREIAVLHSVAIEKELRRRGVGLRLVTRSMREARAAGVIAIALTTMFWNVNFFRRAGFETISRRNLPAPLRQHPLFCSPKYKYTTPMFLEFRRKPAASRKSPRRT
jgi:N-acetylglutamate synthase-like GNAT family acetyltransferase